MAIGLPLSASGRRPSGVTAEGSIASTRPKRNGTAGPPIACREVQAAIVGQCTHAVPPFHRRPGPRRGQPRLDGDDPGVGVEVGVGDARVLLLQGLEPADGIDEPSIAAVGELLLEADGALAAAAGLRDAVVRAAGVPGEAHLRGRAGGRWSEHMQAVQQLSVGYDSMHENEFASSQNGAQEALRRRPCHSRVAT